jgi:hypothetical protein
LPLKKKLEYILILDNQQRWLKANFNCVNDSHPINRRLGIDGLSIGLILLTAKSSPHLFIYHRGTNYWPYICQSSLPDATHATHVEIFNLKNTLRKVN